MSKQLLSMTQDTYAKHLTDSRGELHFGIRRTSINSEELILILITNKNLLSARPPVLSDARVKSVW